MAEQDEVQYRSEVDGVTWILQRAVAATPVAVGAFLVLTFA